MHERWLATGAWVAFVLVVAVVAGLAVSACDLGFHPLFGLSYCAQPSVDPLAADGVGEFLTVGLRTMGPWPFEPATAVLETGAGGDWLLDLGHLGVTVLHGAEHGDAKREVTVSGDPGDVILALYRRDLIGELTVDGDTELWEQLQDWADQD